MIIGIVAMVVAIVLLVTVVARIFAPKPSPPPRPSPHCESRLSDHVTTLTIDQAWWTSIIIGTTVKRKLPARAATIAMATVYQETGIRNLDYGDRDSVGLFQQRPSQGWGSVDEIMDPYYSTGKFLDTLVTINGWEDSDITEMAQAVQRSGFPDAYRKHESNARALASTFTGWDEASVRCLYDQVEGDLKGLDSFLVKTLGIKKGQRDGATVTYTASDERHAWIIAHLAVATGARFGTATVQVDDRRWTHTVDELGHWDGVEESLPDKQVRISVTAPPQ